MKMTRLQQRRSSSCSCGKTTKESKPFVTKNKTYETRSGVQRKQDVSNGFQKNLPVNCNTHNLRGKVFIKKMDGGPIVTLPSLRNGTINGNGTTVDLVKSPTSKVFKKNRKTTVQNGDGNGLMTNSFEEIITAKLKVDFIDIDTNILKKEDPAIANGILADEIVKSLQSETNQNKEIQNGEFVEERNFDPVFLNGEKIKVKEEIVSNGDAENNFNACQHDENLETESEIKQMKKTRIVKRRTAFEIFMNNSIDLSGMNDKRPRKAPSSFSPESPRKLKADNLNVPQSPTQQIKLPVDQPVPYKPVLTKKGLPFKKKGRKPRPKGPVEHYLDVFVRNKSKDKVSCNDQCNDNNQELENDLKVTQKSTAETSEDVDDKPSGEIRTISTNSKSKSFDKLLLPICNAMPIKNRYHDLKRKNIMKKQLSKKRKTFSKMDTDEFSSPIISVLGYRNLSLKKEMLVQFENGTSNWIDYHENEFDVTKMKEYYEHTEQSLSIIHRLGYQTFFPSSSISSLSENEDNDLSSDDESNLDDVFFRSSLPVTKKLNLPLSNEVTTHLTNHDIEMGLNSEQGLKNLCNYTLSSKCNSIYPYQKMQEMFVKNDEDFVSIYLRKLNTKDQKKGDSVNPRCCEKIITTLEDCAVDDICKAVVINGIEEYFASSSIFEKLLKKTPALEGKKYEEDVSILRYLIQTIRNFNKPIIAVIRKTAIGFPASLLSLFDMVFHEREREKPSQTSKPSSKGVKKSLSKQTSQDDEDNDSTGVTETDCQSFVFPRLMGLTQSNENRLMGEDTRPLSPSDCTEKVQCLNEAPLSQQLRNSVRHMRSNSKIQIKRRGRSQSEISEPLPDEDCSDEEDDVIDDVMLPARESNHSEQLERLEREILQEKERTEKYMNELFSYMNSLDD